MARTMDTSVQRRIAPGDVPRGQARAGQRPFGLERIELVLGIVAVVAMAVTVIAGTIGAAVFLAAAVASVAIRPAESVRDLGRFAPLLVLPLLAMVSTIWSDAPERTLRAGIQLMMTVIAAIIVCRRVSGTTLVAVLFLAYLAMCGESLVELPVAMSTRAPLHGLFDSKNQFAFASHLLFGLSLAVAVDRRQNALLRLGAVAAVPLSVLLVVLAQSAGATTSLAVTLLTFPAFLILGRVPLRLQIAILAGTAVLVGLALVLLPDILAAWTDFQVHVLKKDATLTGRTYLWDFGARVIAERPLLGHGYYAFWRPGNIDAEGLWRWAGIRSRSGFNFHNAVVEMRVDLGWVGTGVLVAACAGVAVAALMRQVIRGNVTMAFLLSMLVVLYIRSYAESTLVGPFNMITFLWIATAVYACSGMWGVSRPAGGRTPRGLWAGRFKPVQNRAA